MSSVTRSGALGGVAAPPRVLLTLQVGWVVAYAGLCCTFVAALPTGLGLNSQLTALHVPDQRWSLGDLRSAIDALGLSERSYLLSTYLSVVALGVVCLVVAGLVVWRKPRDRATLVTSVLLAAAGWSIPGTHLALESLYPSWATAFRALGIVAFSCLTLLAYVFPTGTFVPRWTGWVALLMLLLAPLNALDSWLNPQRWPLVLDLAVVAVTLGVPLAAQIYRYRRVSTAVERQQTKWVAGSLVAVVLGSLLLAALGWLAPELGAPGRSGLVYHLVSNWALVALTLLVPLAVGVSLLRLRLWDVDPLLNRTLVYGALTVLAGAVYVGVSGALTAVFPARGNLLVSLLAAGVIAVLFEPARRRLQRLVNRLMYGDRDDPYGVISRLSQRLDGLLAPQLVLQTIAQSVTEAFRVPYTEIALTEVAPAEPGAEESTVIRYPPDTTGVGPRAAPSPDATPGELRLPLQHRGEQLGWLTVAPRAPGEPFSARDQALLQDLVRHAGTAVYTVRAAAELQRARDRLVTAGHEERRRLRRDLHDGLGPMLATLGMKLEVAGELISTDQQESALLVGEVRSELAETLGLVRRLVYGLYPPVLDQLGLPGAIREAATAQLPARGVEVELLLPERLPALPAVTEVAAYYIALEAIQNIQRHAAARSCRVRLDLDDGTLELEISDDGRGLAEAAPGVGLRSMQERAREAGGGCEITSDARGTRVLARLPLSEA